MENHKAIPQGYMTVGEAAKKMGVTVRTLQYYDRKGLFSPTAESAGGRRLYTDKDLVKLHQILSMKHLGFSLDDIKNHLIELETPADIAHALTEQAAAIHEQIRTLSESLRQIEALKTEVLQMQRVDFKKYADIIVNLQMNNEFYWMIKHLDDTALDHFRSHLDMDTAQKLMDTFTHLNKEALCLQREGISPESEEGQALAVSFWNMVTEFTGGDMSLLPKLMETENIDGPDNEWNQNQAIVNSFIGSAIDAYFTKLKYNPFEEVPK